MPLSGPSADLPAKLDLKAMHQTVRWFHIDGEHTGTAVYRELEFANRIVNTDGIVVIDDFFSPRYPANTTEAMRYWRRTRSISACSRSVSTRAISAGPRACRATWTSWPRA